MGKEIILDINKIMKQIGINQEEFQKLAETCSAGKSSGTVDPR